MVFILLTYPPLVTNRLSSIFFAAALMNEEMEPGIQLDCLLQLLNITTADTPERQAAAATTMVIHGSGSITLQHWPC